MSRVDQVKLLIDFDKVPDFIANSRGVADAVEAIYRSSKRKDEKLVGIFDACVTYGLYDETDLPEVTS